MKQGGGGDLRARVHRVKIESIGGVTARSSEFVHRCLVLLLYSLEQLHREQGLCQEPKTVCVEISTSMVAESGGGSTRVTSRGERGGAGLLSGCGERTRWPDADVPPARGGVTGQLWKMYRYTQ